VLADQVLYSVLPGINASNIPAPVATAGVGS
jgi:hypothetical protein